MKLAHVFGRSVIRRQQGSSRRLRFESLETRDLMAGDVFIGPQPKPAGDRSLVVEYNFTEASLVDDIKRAVAGMTRGSDAQATNAMRNAPTEVVNGGQAAARTADKATEVVNGGQEMARLADAATEVVDGGQKAVHIFDAATEIVDGGQDAARALSDCWADLPTFIKTAEYGAAHDAHLAAVAAGDTAEAIRTSNQMRALEVLEYPDGSRYFYLTGEPYIPASQCDEAVELVAESGSAAGSVAGKVLGVVGTAADFVVDPLLGTIFYDENLETGEDVFGENTYCSEAYANLQCVPALGGPLADVSACIYTICTTDWGTAIFGADEVPTPAEVQAAIDRYRDLENRKDYDANHGNLYQEYLWEEVLEAKDELESMGINPAAVR